MDTPEIYTEFVKANGIRFEVNMCGKGDKLALFLHGCPQTAYSWRHLMPVPAKLGYTAWAPNMRGYGDSSCPPKVKDYAIETLMDDVAGLIDVSGFKSVTLITHDWGALLTWFFLTRKIRPVEQAIIMNAPHPRVYEKAVRTHPKQILMSWYVFLFLIPWLPDFYMKAFNGRALVNQLIKMSKGKRVFTEDDLEVYRKNVLKPGRARAMIHYYRDLMYNGRKRQGKLGFPKIDVPILMIWGLDDLALCRETTFGTEKYVENLTLRYLPTVTHWVPEDAPETVSLMIEAWLTGKPVPEVGLNGKII